ncbi:MAG TPA: Wzz/FepE/Etk N-terminal domain-containing protein [Magnetospirillaceae bacterium]|jgi:uncharacterized protein involved in exopolysaccharide biosynthesis/Mrp family chromosome partitioning ATPase
MLAIQSSGTAGTAKAFTLRDLLILAFYNKRIIAICALLPLVVGISAALETRTQYTADGLMMVFVNREHTGNEDLTGTGPTVVSIDGLKMVESEIEIIQSDDVVGRVVDDVGANVLFPELTQTRLFGLLPPTPADAIHRRAIEMFRREMRAEVRSDTDIIRVSFEHPNRIVAIKAVKSLIATYLDRRREVYQNPSSPFLASQVSHFSSQLHGLDSQIDQIKKDHEVVDITSDINLAVNQKDSVLQRQRQVTERREAVRSEIVRTQKEYDALPPKVFAFSDQSNQNANSNDHNTLVQLELDRAHMATLYAADYPPLKEIDRKIDVLRKTINDKRPVFQSTREDRNPALDFVTQHLIALRAEGDALDHQLDVLGKQSIDADARVADLRGADDLLHDLQRTRDLTEGLYKEFSLKEAAARIGEDAAKVRASNVRVVQWANSPSTGSNMALNFILAGIFGGLLMGGAAGMLATWMRQSYIMPSEAERSLGIPVLADFAESAEGYAGRGARQELVRLASAMLDVLVDNQPLSVFQFVSVNMNDSEAGLVQALATEFAQNRNLNTLVIDLAGDGQGVAKGLGATPPAPHGDHPETTRNAVVAAGTNVSKLAVAVDATQSAIGSLRTTLVQLEDLLDDVRRRYDVVLINAPSPIQSHVARRLSSLVDATLVVLRAEHTRVPAAQQLRDIILGSGGDLLGFVFTMRRYYVPKVVYKWL